MNFYIKQNVFNLWGEKFNIQNEEFQDCFQVKTAFKFFKKYLVLDMQNNTLLILKKRYGRILKRWDICDAQGKLLFIVKQRFTPFRPSFKIVNVDPSVSGNYSVSGNIFTFTFQIKKDEQEISSVTKKVVSFGDSYEISVTDPNEIMRSIAITLVFDAVNHRKKTSFGNITNIIGG